jgi:molybdate transport system ATP-binding protein
MNLELDQLRLAVPGFALAVHTTITARVAAVCGPSGAGKTTLLEVIAGLRRPAAGRLSLDGDTLDDGPHHVPAARRRIGYVPQDGALFPHLDVRANLFYGAARAGRGSGGGPAPERVIDVLDLAPLLARRVPGLSGGERQRLALGRALLSGPRLLLLDEPLANLDPARRERIRGYLQRVNNELGVPMLYVTHDARDVAELAEVVLVLDGGRMVATGPPAELLEPDPEAVRFRR